MKKGDKLTQHLKKDLIDGLRDIFDESGENIWVYMSKMFLNEIMEKMANINKNIVNKNYVDIMNDSHKLKSSAGNIGLIELSNIFGEIDEYCFNNSNNIEWDKMSLFIKRIEKILPECISEVDIMIKEF